MITRGNAQEPRMNKQQLLDTVARAKAGDATSYSLLLKEYQSRLYGFFIRATGNHHDAEDLLGELVLRIVRSLELYDEKGRFEAWLFCMASNLVRDRIRRRKAGPSVMSLSVTDQEGHSISASLPALQPAVDAAILSSEVSVQLHDALAKLDDITREMILLRHFGEMSFREISSIFKCPTGTALARIHRGLKVLRDTITIDDKQKDM